MSTEDEQGYDAGFAVIPRSIQRDPTISMKAKMVYITLSSRANDKMQCWPSQSRIAKESGMSVDSVQRGLEELRSRGLVSWELDTSKGSPGRHPNRYTLGGLAAPHTAESGMSDRPERSVRPPSAVQTIPINDANQEEKRPASRRPQTPTKGRRAQPLRSVGGPPSPAEDWGPSWVGAL